MSGGAAVLPTTRVQDGVQQRVVDAGGGRILARVQAILDRPCCLSRPRITLSYAQSLDGCIAADPDTQTQISNRGSRIVTHRLRAMHDAILVGITTVLTDDPRLNVRHVSGDDPTPVIVDSRLRTPPDARVLRNPSTNPIIATTARASKERAARLTEAGAEVLRFSSEPSGLVDLRELFACLSERNVRSLMVEGGAKVVTNLLLGRCADQLVLFVSPIVLGGVHVVRDMCAVPCESRPRLSNVSFEALSDDLIVHGEFERVRE